jgi:hypothetical protein
MPLALALPTSRRRVRGDDPIFVERGHGVEVAVVGGRGEMPGYPQRCPAGEIAQVGEEVRFGGSARRGGRPARPPLLVARVLNLFLGSGQ